MSSPFAMPLSHDRLTASFWSDRKLTSQLCKALLALVLPFLASGTVHAGDLAEVDVLGFSRDGTRFAFEQYGIEAGSGFPYSQVFVIDVDNDQWIAPSPFSFREEDIPPAPDFELLLNDTRHVTLQSAHESSLLDGIAPRGHTVGHNPVTELSADTSRMLVSPRPVLPAIDVPLQFELEAFPLEDETCASYGAKTAGFNLTLTIGDSTRVLHEDSSLPKSRGCPLSYHVERVLTYYPEQTASAKGRFVVLIFMETLGFEGPNGRFLAVSGKI